MARVLVSVCCQPPWVHKLVVFGLMGLLQDHRHKVRVILPTHRPFENALHHVVKDFLASDADWWLSIDADNPPLRNPLDLIDLDLDICGLPTPVWHYTGKKPGERPYYWNAYRVAGDAYREWLPQEGLQKVDAVGTGCVLFARRVFEHPALQGGAFTRTQYADGTVEKGNDIAFCERARAAGFSVWAHFDYRCRHFNEVDLLEAIEGFGQVNRG